jgi:purine-binding chemotaxis protein CheW
VYLVVNRREKLLVFRIEDQRYAVQLNTVQRVMRAVYITPVTDVPEGVLGVIKIRGAIIPAVDGRSRLGFDRREIHPDDQFIILETSGGRVALVVDEVLGVREVAAEQFITDENIGLRAKTLLGIAALQDGLTWMYDVHHFVPAQDEERLHSSFSVE